MRIFKILVVFFLILVTSGMVMHPLKLSTSELVYNNGKFYIKTKMFTDDLEMTLRSHCNAPSIDLINVGFDKKAKDCLIRHFNNNFKIKQNGKFIPFNFKKVYFKVQKEVVYAEFESDKFKATNIEIQNTLLFQNIPEQKNIVNVDGAGSGKFDKTLIFENEKQESVKILEFD